MKDMKERYNTDLLSEKNKFNQFINSIKEENRDLKEENDKITKEFKDYIYENNINQKDQERGICLDSLGYDEENRNSKIEMKGYTTKMSIEGQEVQFSNTNFIKNSWTPGEYIETINTLNNEGREL